VAGAAADDHHQLLEAVRVQRARITRSGNVESVNTDDGRSLLIRRIERIVLLFGNRVKVTPARDGRMERVGRRTGRGNGRRTWRSRSAWWD
jgi:hypothetical protein